MKKAKVSKGRIQHVWPYEFKAKDGTIIKKELPHHYSEANKKPLPDCIIDVPDDVRPGFVWNEELQKYAPLIKKPKPKPRSDLIEVIAEKLGMTYEELEKEVMDRKRIRYGITFTKKST